MYKSKIALPLFWIIVGATINAQDIQDNLDKYFSTLSQSMQFNGNVLIAENGRIAFEKSYGYADFESKKLNTSESAFPIASITKTFTATAILQLHERNKLNVDDPVIKYLPDIPYNSITIKHLLTHTSGLPSYNSLFDSLRLEHPDTIFTNADILPRYALIRKPLLYQPGDSGNYDNINFIFLAIIVEKVSGMPFKRYIKEYILKPSGMRNTIIPTFTFYHYLPKEKRKLSGTFRYPYYYSILPEQTDTISYVSKYWHNYNFKGFGEIVSTARDLLKYTEAITNGKLLHKETLEQAFTPGMLNNGKINPVGNGLGWQVSSNTSLGRLVSHTGSMIGQSSILLLNTSKNQTVILLDNTQNGVYDSAIDALETLNGKHVSPVKQSIAKLYGRTLVTKGIPQARKVLETKKNDTANYLLTEYAMNLLGYQLMQNNRYEEALEVFKTDLELFPNSWNVYDSYGEILLKLGKKEEAIKMYQKSIQLNPKNEGGKIVLEQLFNMNK